MELRSSRGMRREVLTRGESKKTLLPTTWRRYKRMLRGTLERGIRRSSAALTWLSFSIVSIQTPCEMCLATISLGGEIKLWTFGGGGWTLAGFFHTLSSNLSVAKLVDAAHICCGTENGAVELWKLPAAMRQGTTTTTLLTAKKPLLYQPQAHRLAVTDVAVFQNVGASIDHDVREARWKPNNLNDAVM
ncbi:unnamed protein product [Aphanomyces euteiches]